MSKCKEAEYRIGTTGTLDGSQCFSGDTLITTNKGNKMIREVSTGDLVASFNEDTKKFEYKRVLNRFDNGVSEKMLKIKTNKGEMIVTHDHEIFTINGWKKAKDLKKDDKILSIK
jgi:intein/homing endonuclease